MALSALTLTTTTGVVGLRFAAAIGGKSAGTVLRVKSGSPGFGVVNAVLSNLSLPYQFNSVTINEYNPATGETNDTTLTITGASARDAQRSANAAVGGVAAQYRLYRTTAADGTIAWVSAYTVAGGGTTSVPVDGGSPTPTPTPAPVFTVQPSISPTSGNASSTTFTASDGTASNATGYTRRWLLSGVAIGTGATISPASAGSLVLEVTATGAGGSTVATSSAVTVGAAITQRLAPVDSNTFWLMTANDRGTAFGHKFIRNSGGSSGNDAGTPWQPWRLSATKEFSSLSADPTSATPVFTYTDDTGAQNYAFSRIGGTFMGSYHGGETLNGAQIVRMNGSDVDPTQATSGSGFYIQHSSTITDGTATVTVTNFRTAVNANGAIDYTCDSISSTATFLRAFVGCIIASADIYSEASFKVDGGSTEYMFPNGRTSAGNGMLYMPVTPMLRVRDPSSGRSIRNTSTLTAAGGLRNGQVWRQPTRTKTYFDLATTSGALGTRSNIAWTTTFEAGSTGATTFPANLPLNPNFDTDLTSWASQSGTTTWSNGTATQATSTTQQNKLTQIIASLDTAGFYLFSAEASTINGMVALGINTNSSTSGAIVNQGAEVGRIGRVIQPTQAQHQIILWQNTNATAGLTEAWDNVVLQKAVAI